MTSAAVKKKRDYSLVGASTRARGRDRARRGRVVPHRRSAQADEGADAALRRAGDPRHRHLARRADRASAAGGVWFWGTWWCVPFFLVYGVLYGSSTDSRWHECGHGTAFKTRWMNDVGLPDRLLHDHAQPGDLALEPCAPPHRHHHRRPRPRDRRHAAAGPAARRARLLRHPRRLACADRHGAQRRSATVSADEKSFIPEMEQPQGDPRRPHLAWRSMSRPSRWRSHCGSFLPLMLIGLPRLYGAWHHGDDRPAAAWRARRQRHRPPAEHAAPST